MSAEDTYRRTSQAPTVLQLVAVGLAALAGLLILAGGGGLLLRVGGLLVVVAAALVGVAQVLLRSSGAARAGGDVERFVGDEIEALRSDVRGDITHAAKQTHRVLAEQIAGLADTVEALRGQIEVLRSHVERNHIAAPANPGTASGSAGVPGVYRHTETVHVTTRQTTMMDNTDHTGAMYANAAGPSGAAPVGGPARGGAAVPGPRRGEEPSGGWAGPPVPSGRGSREVHMGERNAEVRMDDGAAEVRMQDRWASVVQREPQREEPPSGRFEPEQTGGRRGGEAASGRRRRDDSGDEDAQYWSDLRADAGRGGEPARGEGGRPALPAAPSGEPVPGWANGRPERVEEPVAARNQPNEYRGTQYGRPAGGEYGGGPARGAEYRGAPAAGDDYGDEYGGPAGGGEYRGAPAGGADYGDEYVRPAAGVEYGRAPGGTEYGRPAGGAEYGRPAAGGGGEYGRPVNGPEYDRLPTREPYEGGFDPNRYQRYEDEQPTGRRTAR